jgi:hypothetical protein
VGKISKGFTRRGITHYCKRPIQCLAATKILTPHPLTARRVCTAEGGGRGLHTRICASLVRGEDTLVGWKGVAVNILEDARHCSVLHIRKYFGVYSIRS